LEDMRDSKFEGRDSIRNSRL